MTANPKKRPAASPTQGNVRKRPAGAARTPAAAAPARSEGADASGMRVWAEGLDLGPDDGETAKVGTVYLITFARLLRAADVSFELRNPTTLTRQDILDAVLDALENPIRNRFATGRPREQEGPFVLKLLVVRELHADGSVHFHVGLKLSCNARFAAARRTLETRHGLASHWSSSHTQWWSVVRYLTHTNPPKKLVVDGDRLVWSAPGVEFDVFEDAQELFQAKAWTQRRQKTDAESGSQPSTRPFSKGF